MNNEVLKDIDLTLKLLVCLKYIELAQKSSNPAAYQKAGDAQYFLSQYMHNTFAVHK